MPAKNLDLHGNVPDSCPTALIVIDMINDLEFEHGRKLLKTALPAAERIASLKKRAREAGIPVIYANDNFGRWRSDFAEVVGHVLTDNVAGRKLAELLHPDREDYFVLKPKHSAFFSTTLHTLLDYLQVKRLILTGIAGDTCVLVSAADAYMRDLDLFIPRDCTASISPAENRKALEYMERVLHADTRPSAKLDLEKLAGTIGMRKRSRKSSGKRKKGARKSTDSLTGTAAAVEIKAVPVASPSSGNARTIRDTPTRPSRHS